MEAQPLVEADERLSAFVISLKALAQGLRIVVRSANERFSSDVIQTRNLKEKEDSIYINVTLNIKKYFFKVIYLLKQVMW